MSESHPSHFEIEIEIDCAALRRYLNLHFLMAWVTPLVFLGGMLGFARFGNRLKSMSEHPITNPAEWERLRETVQSGWDLVWLALQWTAAGIGLGLLAALIGHLLLTRRLASRIAASLRVTVEGAFLRIRQRSLMWTDRKLHFRSIVDYSVVQTWTMRRHGIEALQMRIATMGPGSVVTVPAVKDCLKMRDVLSEVDAARENG